MPVDYGYLLVFNSSDGLTPRVVSMLNNNFRYIANQITDPIIVMDSGTSFPDPRTDETLFFNTDTGDLYIWHHFEEDQGHGIEEHWDWKLVDIGFVHVDENPPYQSYIRQSEIIFYDKAHHMPYFWYEPANQMGGPGWYSIDDIIRGVVSSMA